MTTGLGRRFELLHGGDTDAARAAIARIKTAGKEVVVVAACLVGVRCRWNGHHQRDDPTVARVVAGAELLPLCPEVLARLGVPRSRITLSGDGRSAIDARGRNVTPQLDAGARLAHLFASEAGATRALLKERSPSCGVHQVYGSDGVREGEGRFTARLRKHGLTIVSDEPPAT